MARAVPPDGFKTTPDGQPVFYPWGNLSKQGYLFASGEAAGRFRTQIHVFLALSLGSMSALHVYYGGLLAPLAACAVSLVIYFAWMLRIIRGLKPYADPEVPDVS